ncbi:MAG TPA: hypothetical protein PLP17_12875, partial [Oligoflexia bacterium]|nr:hypothetical protein [Oligoflexia bacterium]
MFDRRNRNIEPVIPAGTAFRMSCPAQPQEHQTMKVLTPAPERRSTGSGASIVLCAAGTAPVKEKDYTALTEFLARHSAFNHQLLSELKQIDIKRLGEILALSSDFVRQAEQTNGHRGAELEDALLRRRIQNSLAFVQNELSFLKDDVPGWEGNILSMCIDPNRAPQLTCGFRAYLLKRVFGHLQEQGILPKDLEARLVYNEDPTHFALGIYDKTGRGLCILDSWAQKPQVAPRLYYGPSFEQAREKWEADVKKGSDTFDAAVTEFMNRNALAKGEAARIFFSDNYLGGLDYALYHYFAAPDAPQRNNIAPSFFKQVREQLAHTLPADRDAIQRAGNLDDLQPFIVDYFQRFYRLN